MTDGAGSCVNHPGERWTGIGVDGTKANSWRAVTGPAPQPLSGVPKAQSLTRRIRPKTLRRAILRHFVGRGPSDRMPALQYFLSGRRRLNCGQ